LPRNGEHLRIDVVVADTLREGRHLTLDMGGVSAGPLSGSRWGEIRIATEFAVCTVAKAHCSKPRFKEMSREQDGSVPLPTAQSMPSNYHGRASIQHIGGWLVFAAQY
jgi:hypothetical protein